MVKSALGDDFFGDFYTQKGYFTVNGRHFYKVKSHSYLYFKNVALAHDDSNKKDICCLSFLELCFRLCHVIFGAFSHKVLGVVSIVRHYAIYLTTTVTILDGCFLSLNHTDFPPFGLLGNTLLCVTFSLGLYILEGPSAYF